jgi:hypothetical protein
MDRDHFSVVMVALVAVAAITVSSVHIQTDRRADARTELLLPAQTHDAAGSASTTGGSQRSYRYVDVRDANGYPVSTSSPAVASMMSSLGLLPSATSMQLIDSSTVTVQNRDDSIRPIFWVSVDHDRLLYTATSGVTALATATTSATPKAGVTTVTVTSTKPSADPMEVTLQVMQPYFYRAISKDGRIILRWRDTFGSTFQPGNSGRFTVDASSLGGIDYRWVRDQSRSASPDWTIDVCADRNSRKVFGIARVLYYGIWYYRISPGWDADIVPVDWRVCTQYFPTNGVFETLA